MQTTSIRKIASGSRVSEPVVLGRSVHRMHAFLLKVRNPDWTNIPVSYFLTVMLYCELQQLRNNVRLPLTR